MYTINNQYKKPHKKNLAMENFFKDDANKKDTTKFLDTCLDVLFFLQQGTMDIVSILK